MPDINGNADRTSRQTITIVDYGTGNLRSVKRALDRMGAASIVSHDPGVIRRADKIILPGVGHFGKAMEVLEERGLADALNEKAKEKGTPILGICLGMELMACRSEEGNAAGLGWFDAELIRFEHSDKRRLKVPHMGWNQIRSKKSSRLMAGINEGSAEFYFAHSYHLRLNNPDDLVTETDYGITFPSAIERDNIFGVQYHPEKSHDVGAKVLKNFLEM